LFKPQMMADMLKLLRDDKIAEFVAAYQTAGFDIDHYRPLVGAGKLTFLKEALVLNRRDFVGFLGHRIPLEEIANEVIDYQSDRACFKSSPLYMAILNGIDDYALRLIACDKTDLYEGHARVTTQESALGRATVAAYSERDTPFDLAARLNKTAIIDALYTKQAEKLESRAANVRDHGIFFPQLRADHADKQAALFRATRDELLKKCNKISTQPILSPKPHP
jgi:hypothetical protein